MTSLRGVKAGDDLFIVPLGGSARQPRRETVIKIGRKWVEVGLGWSKTRYELDTGLEDSRGYGPDSKAYLHEEEYRSQNRRGELWAQIRAVINRQYLPPAKLTESALHHIAHLLTLESKPPAQDDNVRGSGASGNTQAGLAEGNTSSEAGGVPVGRK